MSKPFSIGRTMLIGLGFFTVAIVWSIYNVAVPTYLDGLGLRSWLLGLVMALDNIFAAAFNPLFGSLSDRTRTRWGRRMPYLLAGIPLAAVFFVAIPYARASVLLLIPVVICMNFFMCVYRSPTVSLMPDLTPPAYRNQANGIINLMGGAGTAVAMLLGATLFGIGESLPFLIAAGLMIATVAVMFRFVREPAAAYAAETKPKDREGVLPDAARRRSVVLILLAVFCWFIAYNGLETYLTLFVQNVMGMGKDIASRLFLAVSAAFLLSAVPAGYAARRFGRKRTILIGIACMILLCGCMTAVRSLAAVYALMAAGGVGWALININSYPMVIELACSRVGAYTGFYYFFSMCAASVSPVMVGGLMDAVEALQRRGLLDKAYVPEEILFPVGFVFFVLAGGCMLFVRHGETACADPGNLVEQVGQMDG